MHKIAVCGNSSLYYNMATNIGIQIDTASIPPFNINVLSACEVAFTITKPEGDRVMI